MPTLRSTLIWSILVVLAGSPAGAGDARSNALQDCWTSNVNLELESYRFEPDENVTFTWSHRIETVCSNYTARILLFECGAGLSKPGALVDTFEIPNGRVAPDPSSPTRTFSRSVTPGGIAPGRYDWVVIAECDDSGNGVSLAPDGDTDDLCGATLGMPPDNPLGPVVFGPNADSALDVDPGADPAGREAGESGTTRPWCFEILP